MIIADRAPIHYPQPLERSLSSRGGECESIERAASEHDRRLKDNQAVDDPFAQKASGEPRAPFHQQGLNTGRPQ